MTDPNFRDLCSELLSAMEDASNAVDRLSDALSKKDFPELIQESFDMIGRHDRLIARVRTELEKPVVTQTTGYRFKIPERSSEHLDSISFGIEPFGVNSKGQTVKTGAAIVRISMWRTYTDSHELGKLVATTIRDHLNSGGKYTGPNTLIIDRTFSLTKMGGYLT